MHPENHEFVMRRKFLAGAVLQVLCCALILLFGSALRVGADPVLNATNGHYYEAISVSNGISWFDARDVATGRSYLGRRGHLATLTSAAEVQFVLTNFPAADSGQYWLGGYQDRNAPDYTEPSGGWRWVTGEPWSYTNWSASQPDNFNNTEDALHFFNHSGAWNDGTGTVALPGYVVEYEYTPQPFDINGDGHSDLVFQNSTTGQVVFWDMNGTAVIGGTALTAMPAAGYRICGTGDFNQDGSADLVFQNSTTGQIVLWYLHGSTYLGGAAVSLIPLAGYQVVGAGDFNSDGLPDLVLQNSVTNRVVIWYMNGTTVLSGSFISLTPDAGYQVSGVNDLNADGHPDLVLQNSTTGRIVIWYMSGITVTDGVSLPNPAPNYSVVGVSAFNGSLPGLVFQNSITHQVAFWYLEGANVIGGGLASGIPDSSYQVVGPR
jgi:hypothetical protein